MDTTEIKSELPEKETKKLTDLIEKCLKVCLETVGNITVEDQKFPHRLEASFEWIRLSSRKSNTSMLGVCAVRVNSSLWFKLEGEEKTVPGYCESFQFDLSSVPQEDIEDYLSGNILKTLSQVHMKTLSLQRPVN